MGKTFGDLANTTLRWRRKRVEELDRLTETGLLSTRARNILHKAINVNAVTVGYLERASDEHLRTFEHVGSATVDEFRAACDARGRRYE